MGRWLLLVVGVASCGGREVVDANAPDAAADASDAGTGACAFDGVGSCLSGPNCCLDPTYNARRVDLARGCVEQASVVVACSPPADKPGQHCARRPTTSDAECVVRHASDGGADEVVITSEDLPGFDGFAYCDEALRTEVSTISGGLDGTEGPTMLCP